MYQHGWFQIAFDRELTREVSPASIGQLRLVLVRVGSEITAFDAICPHRGADLGIGGRHDRGALVCPFHGFRIGLGQDSEHGFCVRRYRTLTIGGLVFVQLSDQHDNGFADALETLARDRFILPGFSLNVRSTADIVIENAFDQAHFRPVHAIGMQGEFSVRPTQNGELTVEGMFDLPISRWQRSQTATDGAYVPFQAKAFSPGVVISDLGGAHPYTVITASTPNGDGSCTIRLSLALPKDEQDRPPKPELCEFLLRRSREGLEKDRVVWEHRCESAPARYMSIDEPVKEFRMFCARFAEMQSYEQPEAH
jgi:nitrite reductase/ring-hydroxylating ferredoxin subunit